MARKRRAFTKRLAYLAYKLGWLPFALLKPFTDTSFPYEYLCCYEGYIAEGLEAIDALQALVEGQRVKADMARHVLKRRWKNLLIEVRFSGTPNVETGPFKSPELAVFRLSDWPAAEQGWMGNALRRILEQEVVPNVEMTPCKNPGLDVLWICGRPDLEWRSLGDTIAAFYTILPEPYLEFARLGAAVGNFVACCQPYTPPRDYCMFHRAGMLDAQRFQTVWGNWEKEEVFVGLDLDLSQQAYQEDQAQCAYFTWARTQVTMLHVAISRRLGPRRSVRELTPKWIRASEAEALAQDFNVSLSLPTISKLARKQPPPFDSRPVDRGLYVRLDSFVQFLWERRNMRRKEATREEIAEAIRRDKEGRETPDLD